MDMENSLVRKEWADLNNQVPGILIGSMEMVNFLEPNRRQV